ncbi:MAG: ABC transporter permease [Luteibaculum sp.]
MSAFQYILAQWLRNKWTVGMVVFFGALANLLLILSSELSGKTEEHVLKNISGIDLVVGAKGSPLQLVLSSVFFIDNPTGNIPVQSYLGFKRNPFVDMAVPLALGDSYQGFRMVGTNNDFKSLFPLDLERGEWFSAESEVLLGADLVTELNLEIGDVIYSQHGTDNRGKKHQHPLQVSGILEKCGCPVDRLILTDVKTIQDSHGEEAKNELTAVLMRTKSALGKLQLPRQINEKSQLQAAIPSIEADRLLQLSSGVFKLLRFFSGVLFVVCALAMLAAFMSRIKEMMRDAIVLRIAGFSRLKVLLLMFCEAMGMGVLGYLTALAAYPIITLFALEGLIGQYGFNVQSFPGGSTLLLSATAVFAMVLVALLVPAFRFSRSSIHAIVSKELY